MTFPDEVELVGTGRMIQPQQRANVPTMGSEGCFMPTMWRKEIWLNV